MSAHIFKQNNRSRSVDGKPDRWFVRDGRVDRHWESEIIKADGREGPGREDDGKVKLHKDDAGSEK